MAEQHQDHQRRIGFEAAATIPGVVAIVLGALYTLGAVFKAAEFQRAHVSVRDYLPLVPLQQILGVGIATMAPLLPSLLLLAAMVALAGALIDRTRGMFRAMVGGSRVLLAFLGLLTLLITLTLPPLMSLAAVLAVLIMLGTRNAREGFFARSSSAMAVAYLIIGIGAVLNYVAYPKPLAIATVHLANGTEMRGRLILDTGSVYYIASANRRSVLVEHTAARNVSIRTRSRPWRSTFDLMRWW